MSQMINTSFDGGDDYDGDDGGDDDDAADDGTDYDDGNDGELITMAIMMPCNSPSPTAGTRP